MALLAFIVLAAGSIGLFCGLFIVLITRHSKYRTEYGAIIFLITGAIAFGILIFNAQYIIDSSTSVGFGVSAEEANKHLILFDLPPQATDVNYRYNPWLGTTDLADFAIDEKPFLAWAKRDGWKMTRFIIADRENELAIDSLDNSIPFEVDNYPLSVDPTRCYVKECYDNESVEICNGYYASTYTEENSDFGKRIVYDLDNGRAYVIATNR